MSDFIIETNTVNEKVWVNKELLDDVDLKVQKGEIYGFLGPNGAGKTTTIRMLLGLARPTKGSIHIFGKDVKKEKLSILKKGGLSC